MKDKELGDQRDRDIERQGDAKTQICRDVNMCTHRDINLWLYGFVGVYTQIKTDRRIDK